MPKLTPARCLNLLPLLALAGVLGAAAWDRFRLPLVPCADPDVWAYLGPGVGALLGGPFHEWFGQCFLYPWFLYALLRVGGDFRWIMLAQHGLGLGAGALLFACWAELRRWVPAPRVPWPVYGLLGAALAWVYLFSTATMQFERALRPEAIFPFAVILQIYCLLRFLRARFRDGQGRVAVVSGGLAAFLSVAAWLLKPSFSAMLLLANLPLLISLFRRGQSVRGKLLLVGWPALAAGLLLVWPELRLRQDDPAGPLYLAQSLFSIHADLIDRQLADDAARRAPTPYPPELLAAAHAALSGALEEARGKPGENWPLLGFNPDYLRLGGAGRRAFLGELGDLLTGGEPPPPGRGRGKRRARAQAAELQFCRYYYARTWRGQTAGMLGKVARQFGAFYCFGSSPVYISYDHFDLAQEYRQSVGSLAPHEQLKSCPPGVALLARSAALADSPQRIGPYRHAAEADFFLACTHLGWCLWALALAAGAWGFRPVRAAFGGVAPVLLLLYSYNFGTVLTLAVGHSLDVGRYSMYQFSYTLLPEFAAVWLAAEALLLLLAQASRLCLSRGWGAALPAAGPGHWEGWRFDSRDGHF